MTKIQVGQMYVACDQWEGIGAEVPINSGDRLLIMERIPPDPKSPFYWAESYRVLVKGQTRVIIPNDRSLRPA